MNSGEKIHEFVNMARHPEAGSYEQLCEKIKFEVGSLILHTYRESDCNYGATGYNLLKVLHRSNDTLYCKLWDNDKTDGYDSRLFEFDLNETTGDCIMYPEIFRFCDSIFYDKDNNVIDLKTYKVLYPNDDYLDDNGCIKEYLYRAEDGNIYYKDGDETEEDKSVAIEENFCRNSGLITPYTVGRPITAFDVCWALNKKTAEFNFSVDTRGISFSRFCKMEADGNLVSCMPSLQGLKRGKGNIPFKTIEEDGTHTILYQWGSKICNNLAILMYSNEEIIEIAKLLSRK